MKPNELRLGNWVNKKYHEYPANTGSYWSENPMVLNDFEGIIQYPDVYKPIPLTPEWLGKFAFKEWLHGVYSLGFVNLRKNIIRDGSGNYDGFYLDDYPKAKPFKHIHQLQNLYFALTGNELEIKELNENG